jgi:hypothetical protein
MRPQDPSLKADVSEEISASNQTLKSDVQTLPSFFNFLHIFQIEFLRKCFPPTFPDFKLIQAYLSSERNLAKTLDLLFLPETAQNPIQCPIPQPIPQTTPQSLPNNLQPGISQPLVVSPPISRPGSAKCWQWCTDACSEVCTGGIESLPDIFSKSEPLKARFLLHSIIQYDGTIADARKPEDRNPVNTGTLDGWTYNVRHTGPLFRIRYVCSGNQKQCCSAPVIPKNSIQVKCSVELNIMVFVGKYSAFISGSHGPNFKPGAVKNTLNWKQKKKIEELDGVQGSSLILNTTAKQAHINLSKSCKSTPPPLQVVSNRLKYRRSRVNKNLTDFELLLQYFKDPEYSSYVLWNNLEEVGADGDIMVICTSDFLIQKMRINCSRYAGLDSGWKWSTGNFPCWLETNL